MHNSEKILNENGLPMLTARRAAQRLHCAPDYISRLCREGKLKGRRLKNAWFVDEASILAFEQVRTVSKVERNQELSELRRKENALYRRTAPPAPLPAPVPVSGTASLESSFFKNAFALGLGLLLLFTTVVTTAAVNRNSFAGTGLSHELSAAISQIQSPFFGTHPFSISFPNLLPEKFGFNIFSAFFASRPVTLSPIATSQSTSTSTTIVNNYPVIERTVERAVAVDAVSRAEFESRLLSLTRFVVELNAESSQRRIYIGGGSSGGGDTVQNITNITQSGGSDFGQAFEITNDYLSPTTTLGILIGASSTIGAGTQGGGLTIHGGATTTGSFYIAGNLRVAGLSSCDTIDSDVNGNLICGSDQTAAGAANPFSFLTSFGTTTAATSSALWARNGIFASSTSHFENADFAIATTGALTVSSVTSSLLKTNALGQVVAAVAGTDYANFAYPFPNAATSTLLTFTNGVIVSASSTIASLTTLNSTSTNATTTNLAVTSIISSLLKTNSSGSVIAAIAGTDYVIPSQLFAYPFPSNATTTHLTFSGGASTTNFSANTLAVGGTGTTSISSSGALTIQTINGLLKATSGLVSAATAGVDYENPLTFVYPFVRSADSISLAFGTTTANTWSAHNIFSSLFATNASSTNATTTQLAVTSLTSGRVPFTTTGGRLIDSANLTFDGTTLTANTLALTNALTVANGGTGQTSFTSGQLLYGAGTGALQTVATGTVQAGSGIGVTGSRYVIGGDLTITNLIGYPFIPGMNFGTSTSATSTSLHTAGVFFASSTTQASQLPFASTTAISVSGRASTTNLTISGLLSSLLKTDASGNVTAAIAGTDYQTFAYPFPNAATSTLLTFNGGLSTTNATATSMFASEVLGNIARFGQTGSTTISSTGALLTPSLTVGSLGGVFAGNSGLTYAVATGTVTAGSGISLDATRFVIGGDLTITNTIGYPFNGSGNSTSTLTQFNGGLTSFASTTIGSGTQAGGLTIFGGATTTGNLLVQGSGTSTFSAGLSAASFSVTGAGSSTFANGINLTNGCYAVHGACLSVTGSSSQEPFPNLATTSVLTFTNGLLSGASTTINGNLVITGNATATNATTTRFAITNLTNALLTTNALGSVVSSSTLSVAFGGTGLSTAPTFGQLLVGNSTNGYSLMATSSLGLPTFAYPFPNAATTTTLTFSGGLLSLASTTIGNGTEGSGLTIFGGATTTGNLTVQGNATSSHFAVTGNLRVLSLSNCDTIDTDSNGNFACGNDSGAGGSNEINWTYFNGSGVRVSTTSNQVLIGATATTSLAKLEVRGGNIYFQNNLGIATTSPFAPLSVHANDGSNNLTLFAIGSSTASATTTLFSVSNTGSTTIANGVNITSGCFALGGTCTVAQIGPAGQLQNGTITFATSSDTNIGLTVVGSGNTLTFTSTWSGTLSVARGGTNNANALPANSLVYFDGTRYNATSSNPLYVGAVVATSTSAHSSVASSLGVGTTSPFGRLTVFADHTSGIQNSSVFFVASTSPSGTTTLFRISNTGVITSGASATSTFSAGILASGLDSSNGLTVSGGNARVATLQNCDSIDTDNNGNLTCGSDAGSSGTTEINWTYFNGSGVRVSTTTNAVLIGGTSTSTDSKLEVVGGNAYFGNNVSIGSTSPYARLSIHAMDGETARTLFSIGSSTASATSTHFAVTNNGNVGLGTSTPFSKLSIVGGNIMQVAGDLTSAGSAGTANNTYGTYVSGRYAYVAEYAGGVKILDISNPKAPSVVGSYTGISTALSVVVAGSYAYVADEDTGLVILDVSRPNSPTLVGRYTMPDSGSGNTRGIAISGKYVFVNEFVVGATRIIDVSDPANPRLAGSFTSTAPIDVAVSGRYLYVADWTPAFYIVDISNPAAPVQVGSYTAAAISSPVGIYVSGRYAYVVDADNGFISFDVSNPASPIVSGTFSQAPDNYQDVQVAGNYAYLAASNGRTIVLDLSASTSPRFVSEFSSGGTGRDIFISGKYAYLANDASGLRVIDLNGAEVPTARIGSLESNMLNVSENLDVGGEIRANGGLNVGISGILSRGTIAAFIASSTQTNAAAATFMGGNVGIGTTSPFARLSVFATPNSNLGTTLFAIGSTTGTATTTFFSINNVGSTTIHQMPSALLTTNSSGLIVASSTLSVNYGGTGLSTAPTYGQLLVGNSTGGYTLTATSSLGLPTFAYPFPNAATSTNITFNGGFTIGGTSYSYLNGYPFTPGTNFGTSTSATSTSLHTAGVFFASSTTQASQFPYASSTAISVSGRASTTNLTISSVLSSLLKTDASGNVTAAVAGTDYANFAFPFTRTTNYGQTVNATTTPLWFQSGLMSSSTAHFIAATFASTSNYSLVGTSSLINLDGKNLLTASVSGGSIAIGPNAKGVDGTTNTTVGSNAGHSLEAGSSNNVAVGSFALELTTTGAQNVAVGASALDRNITGQTNVGVGYSALFSSKTGSSNTALGASASYNNLSATNTVAVGFEAYKGTGAFSAQGYSALGYRAGVNAASGADYNTLFGFQAGSAITSGYGNILIGPSVTANNLTTGDGNIGIGYNIFFPSDTGDGQLNIGGLVFGTLPATSTQFRLPTTGAIGIASSSPFATLSVHGVHGSTNKVIFAVGSSTASATSTLFSVSNTGSTTLFQLTSSLLKTDSSGAIVAAVLGSDYQNFAYPFPNAATSTNITFNGGFTIGGTSYSYLNGYPFTPGTNFGTSTSATSTSLHTAGVFFASSTTQASQFPYASTTALTVSGTASTTNLNISGISNALLKTVNGVVTAAVAGTDYQTFAFPFTGTTNFGAVTNSTSTPLLFTAGLQASTTVRFGNAGGQQFLWNSTTGNLGLGTTTPYWSLEVASTSPSIALTDTDAPTDTKHWLLSNLDGVFHIGVVEESSSLNSTSSELIIDKNLLNFAVLTGLENNTTGGETIALGFGALQANTTGGQNVAVGSGAVLGSNTTGSGNIGIGDASMRWNETGSENVAIGAGSLFSNPFSGDQNIGIGIRAARNITSGSGNIAIGYNALVPSATNHLQLSIGNLIFGTLPATTSATSLTLPTTGKIGIATSSPFAKLSVHANNGSTDSMLFAIGSSTASATTTLFSVNSVGSTTLFRIPNQSLLKVDSAGAIVAAVAGSDYAAASSVFAFPFTTATNFGQTVAATTTALWLQGSPISLMASSTIVAPRIDFWPATSTVLSYQGRELLIASTTNFSTFLGLGAGTSTLAASERSTGIGYEALQANTVGDDNTAVGYRALFSTTNVGGRNTAVGAEALLSNTTGALNVAVGDDALDANTTGGQNIAMGSNALGSNTTGSGNVAIGNAALLTTTQGSYNTAVGDTALGSLDGGSENVAIGRWAGHSISTGYSNILIGSSLSTANTITTGAGNIGLGNSLYFPSATANNQLNIGGILFGTLPATSTQFRLPTTGAIGIASSSPFATLSVHGVHGSTNTTLFAVGSSTANSTSTLFSVNTVGSTTLFRIPNQSLLKVDSAGAIVAAVAGSDYAAASSVFAFPFTGTTNFGVTTNSTTTALWAQAGLFASSTSQFNAANFWNGAVVGASTTPFAMFGINVASSSGTTTLFAIGSTTNTGATRTLFSVNNIGSTTLFQIPSALLTTNAAGTIVASSTLSVNYGGTGLSTAPSFGNILVGNSTGGYTLTATSSLGLATFAYPFPNAATTTLLTFSGGASTTNFSANTLAVGGTGTTTISSTGALFTPTLTVGSLSGFIGGNNGLLYAFATSTIRTSQLTNDAGFTTFAWPFTPGTNFGTSTSATSTSLHTAGVFFASSTTQASQFPYASTTALTVSGTASTTNLNISGISNALLKTVNGVVTAAVAGTDYQTFSFPFTGTTNFGATANSTSTPIWFQGGLQASSTSYIASTTFLSTGYIGMGSTTPWGYFSINPTAQLGASPSFVIGSSSATNFLVTNAGQVGVGTANPWGKLAVSGSNLSSTWQQVGSLDDIAGITNIAALAALSPNRVAFIDGSNDDLRTYEWNGSTWILVGSLDNISTVDEVAIAALSPNRVAFIDDDNDQLRTYEWNGSTWTLVGSALSVPGVNISMALAALSSNRVAFIDGTNDQLRTYEWNGSTWTLVGALNISSVAGPSLAALSPNRVAFIDAANDQLRTYEWNGSTWALVGSGLTVSGLGNSALTALSPNRVALADQNTLTLRTYEWNGSTWTLVGTLDNISGIISPALAALSPNRVAFIDIGNDDLRMYQWSTPLLYIAGAQDQHYFSVSDVGYAYAEGLAVRTDLTVGQSATSTAGTSTPALIVNGTATFSGLVGIGTTSPSAQLTILANRTASNLLFNIASSTSASTSPATSLLSVGVDGRLAIGTSSPFAKLSIQANSNEVINTTLFAVGSSTASATTTLFSVSNTGSTTIGNFGTCSGANAVTTNSSGTLVCGAVTATGDGVGSWFTGTTNFGATANSTSTPIWFQAGLQASSTARFMDISTIGILSFATSSSNASSTLISLNGQTFLSASTSATVGNLFLGLSAGAAITRGNTSTGFGFQTLASSTIGTENTAVGYQALRSSVSGVENTAVGYKALSLLAAGAGSNTAIGSNAMVNATNTSINIAIGKSALAGNAVTFTGTNNVAIGNNALAEITSGGFNTALGHGTIDSVTSGAFNTAVGWSALDDLTTGISNVAFGLSAGAGVTTGYGNTILGTAAGTDITTGFGNIIIGTETFATSSTAVRTLNLGGILFGDLPATSTAFKLPTEGRISVGSSTPFSKFSIHSNNGDTNTTLFAIGSSTDSATSTLFSISNTGSTTIGNFGTCSGANAVTTNSSGTLVCGTVTATGDGVGSWFTGTTNFGATANSTSTPIWFQAGLMASSTSRLNAGIAYNGFAVGATTTSPLGLFSIHAPAGSATTTLFAIGSTTAAGAHSTLLSVDNTGALTVTTLQGAGLASCNSNNVLTWSAGSFGCETDDSGTAGGGDKIFAVYATSTVGTTTVEFTGNAGTAPSFSAGTLVLPSDTVAVVVEVWGGGGGGGGADSDTTEDVAAAGGGGGGYSKTIVTSLGASYKFAVGAGGAAGSNAGGTGGIGGTTCFGTNAIACSSPTIRATGGTGGVGSGSGANADSNKLPGTGGDGFSGAENLTGEDGRSHIADSGIGDGGGDAPRGGRGGATVQQNGATDSAGSAGNAPGGGGGGATDDDNTGSLGGAGGTGGVVITVYTSSSVGSIAASTLEGQLPFYAAAGTSSLTATSSIYISSNTNFGVGSTSPYARLSVHALSNAPAATTLFAIGSSTDSATSTLFSVSNTGIASTTGLVISNTAGSGTRCLQVDSSGTVSANVSACGSGSGGADFTYGQTNFGQTVSATSTPIWFQAGLQASSTARLMDFSTIGILSFASTTSNASSTLVKWNGAPFIVASTSENGGNTGVGQGVLARITSGIGNAAFGEFALARTTSGTGNTAVGSQAMFGNTTGESNTAIGASALTANTAGDSNVAVGYLTLNAATDVSRSVVIGTGAMQGLDSFTNADAVVIGYGALSNIDGTDIALRTIAIGSNAGSTSEGNDNIIIGASAGGLTTGSANILIGNYAKAIATNSYNKLNIGGLLFGTLPATSTEFYLPQAGAIGIATSSPFATFGIHAVNGSTNTTLFAIGSSTDSATSTLFSVSNTGSTTIGNFGTCSGANAVTTNSSGTLVCGTVTAAGDGVGNWFTGTTNFGATANSTSTPIWFQAGLQASSTAYLSDLTIDGVLSFTATTSNATSTLATFNGASFIAASSTGFNTALGAHSLSNITSGIHNTAFGHQALMNASSTSNNVAVGSGALEGSTTTFSGSTNVAVGKWALASTSSGSNNVAVGYEALRLNTTGATNIAIGKEVLELNTTGSNNIGIGNSSTLAVNTVASNNIAIGTAALRVTGQNTGYSNNIGIGANAFLNADELSGMVGIGDSVAANFTGSGTTSNGVVIGYRAALGGAGARGSGFTIIGFEAGKRLVSGVEHSTLIGSLAGAFLTNGYGNISIGASSTQNLTTGSNNIGIGNFSNMPSATADNQLNIGNLIYGTLPATSTDFTLPTTGSVGIGTTSPHARLGISLNHGGTLTNAFLISSSTDSATTTLFSISNTGSTTVANGVNITDGCFAVDDVCLTSGGSAGGLDTQVQFNDGGSAFGGDADFVFNKTFNRLTVTNASTSVLSITGGQLDFSAASATTTIRANGAYSFTIATSTSGLPIIAIDGTTGTTTIGIPGGDIIIGSVLSGTNGRNISNLVFEASSTIHAQGDGATLTFGTAGDKLNFAVNTGFGSSTPWQALSVVGGVAINGLTSTSTPGNSVCISNTFLVTFRANNTCSAASSERFKESINSLTATSGLAAVLALRPVTYNYTQEYMGAFADDPNWTAQKVGFIAEEVQAVDPRLITINDEGLPETVRYEHITAILTKATQELNAKVDSIASSSVSSSTVASLQNTQVQLSGVQTTLTGRVAQNEVTISSLASEVSSTSAAIANLQIEIGELTQMIGGDIVAQSITVATTTTQTLCIGDTCFDSALAASLATTTATSSVEDILEGSYASATSSPNFLSSFTSYFEFIVDFAQVGIKELGVAVRATVAVFDNLFTQELTAIVINAEEVNTQKLCLDDLCISKVELQALLNGQSGTTGTTGTTDTTSTSEETPTETSTSTPPVAETPDPTEPEPEPAAETAAETTEPPPAEDPAPEVTVTESAPESES